MLKYAEEVIMVISHNDYNHLNYSISFEKALKIKHILK